MPVAAHSRTTDTKPKGRPWPQIAVILLLIGQIAGAGVLGYFHITTLEPLNLWALSGERLVDTLLQALGLVVGLAFIIVFSLVAILAILRWWRNAWMLAMFVQTITMVIALILYANERPFYTYLVMLYAVVMVVYMILPGVQAAFLPRGDAT